MFQSVFDGDITNHTEFGESLRVRLRGNDLARLLPDGTWMAGGCWILARALRDWIDDPARLIAIGNDQCPIHHVAVEFERLYLDADGLASGPDLLRKMEVVEQVDAPRIVEFDPQLARRLGIPERPDISAVLLKRFRSEWGDLCPAAFYVDDIPDNDAPAP